LHAVLLACMDVNQIWKIDIFSKRLLYKLFEGRPITETTGYNFGVLWWQIYLSLQKNTKNVKSLLTNLLHRGTLKTTSWSAGWAALYYIICQHCSTTPMRWASHERVHGHDLFCQAISKSCRIHCRIKNNILQMILTKYCQNSATFFHYR